MLKKKEKNHDAYCQYLNQSDTLFVQRIEIQNSVCYRKVFWVVRYPTPCNHIFNIRRQVLIIQVWRIKKRKREKNLKKKKNDDYETRGKRFEIVIEIKIKPISKHFHSTICSSNERCSLKINLDRNWEVLYIRSE